MLFDCCPIASDMVSQCTMSCLSCRFAALLTSQEEREEGSGCSLTAAQLVSWCTACFMSCIFAAMLTGREEQEQKLGCSLIAVRVAVVW